MRALLPILIMLGAIGSADAQDAGNYANANGLKMYFEVHGEGFPLVALPGGHGDYMGELTTLKPGRPDYPALTIVEEFLDEATMPGAQ